MQPSSTPNFVEGPCAAAAPRPAAAATNKSLLVNMRLELLSRCIHYGIKQRKRCPDVHSLRQAANVPGRPHVTAGYPRSVNWKLVTGDKMTLLESLKKYTTVVADTGDIDAI